MIISFGLVTGAMLKPVKGFADGVF